MTQPLLVDLYPKDLGGKPDVAALVAAGSPWSGLILKVSQGLFCPSQIKGYTDEWLMKHGPLARTLAGERYGWDWWRGFYHYADVSKSASLQVDWFLRLVEKCGGWGRGDLWPMLDMEQARNPEKPGRAHLEDWINTYADAMARKHGRRPTLYGNIYLWENHVQGLCGCENLILARYRPTLTPDKHERIGIPASKLLGWQYVGTQEPGRPPSIGPGGYPMITPLSHERQDITALVVEGGLEHLRAHTWAERP
ncbi:MAG: hypothetical protein H0U52_06890 [Chloroflexi bacterium]|nr:hypothetical protein [Chloroflexota bacterium]